MFTCPCPPDATSDSNNLAVISVCVCVCVCVCVFRNSTTETCPTTPRGEGKETRRREGDESVELIWRLCACDYRVHINDDA